MRLLIAIALLIVAGLVGAQFVTVFVVQPIGAVPEGRTLIITRLTTLKFIDSADAWCEREVGYVNLLCRMGTLGRVGEKATVIARLPYSETLYKFSTGGKVYNR